MYFIEIVRKFNKNVFYNSIKLKINTYKFTIQLLQPFKLYEDLAQKYTLRQFL